MNAPHLRLGIATAALAVLLSLLIQGFSVERRADLSPASDDRATGAASDEVTLMVLYPQPEDVAQFGDDYRAHLQLLHRAMDLPDDERPYTVTRFAPSPDGPAPYYQLFSLTFASAEALQQAMARPAMQEVAADAARISSGGAPVVLVGSEM